jgi:hypothetical protein
MVEVRVAPDVDQVQGRSALTPGAGHTRFKDFSGSCRRRLGRLDDEAEIEHLAL